MIDGKKLKGMSREDKLKLFELMEEQERRARKNHVLYTPNDGQKIVHASTKKIRLVISGNGAGKSTLGANEVVWAAKGFNPISGAYQRVPRRVIVVLDKPDKVADKWIPEIRKWHDTSDWQFNKSGKPYVSQILLPNASEIRFFFHEQDPLSFESLEVDDVVFDEPPPRHIYIALIRGMRNKDFQARILIIGTPITGSWLRTDIYEPWANGETDDTECFRFGTQVNSANLPEGYVEWFASKLSEKERAIRIEGQFFDLDGLALAHLFKKDKHLLPRDYEWDKSRWPCVVSIDPHPSKKNVALLIGANSEGLVVLKELALKMVAKDFAVELQKWYKGYRVIDIVVDSLGSSEMTGGEGFASFIEVLNRNGVRARATTFQDKNDEEWVDRIQSVLAISENQQPQLKILDNCSGLIHDIENVSWSRLRNSEDFKPTLDISRRDYLACLKYGLACNLNYKKGKAQVYYRNKPAYGFSPPTLAKMQMKVKRNGF